ncbi:dihydrolipoyl dehydrogenase [Actinomadura sp. NBRC 104412]|uniref:dihydrolipoyl dehydrogenase n=1 Tax=Actinomadura sp. NBRC 104412 TaxID=3032203 RepID=UPI0024A29891|nr:dihydrolipoyl dehydrogenase [Actinomadura sp. NBRC 104412]GLZ03444.1 dihydrolipoyl dehydrogenase [Actinomadura sp. NBRC 104412]
MVDSGPFDIVVLGGGSGGYACALRAAELGSSVALIERAELGGTCLNRGCIPTKALLHAAEVADQTREAATFGIRASFDGIDIDGVNAYKDKVVSTTVKGLTGLIKSKGITVVEGEGRLTGPTSVEVTRKDGTTTTLEGQHIVLATGSRPKTLPGLEIDGERIISSDHALLLKHVPASVVIVGGGVIGVEFASIWRSFGAEVTIVEALPHLLPMEEESSSKRLERAFRRRGITFELGAKFKEVKTTQGGIALTLENGTTLDAETLLVAVGRAPVSEGIGLETAGVATENGFVKVDEHCRTNVPTISAVGDLIPTLQLAHAGFAEGILVAERLGGLNPAPIDYDGVPRITYSNPEVASVGITTATARERGHEVREVVYDLAGNPKSKILGTQGEVKVITAVEGPVLGVHLVGARVGELIAEGQLIYNWEALPAEVAQLIHPHPTQSEAIGEAHLALAGKPLHVHG